MGSRNLWMVVIPCLVLVSCSYNDITIQYKVCDCVGTRLQNVVNEPGVIASTVDGYRIISVNHGYISTCTDIPAEFQVEGTIVYFSGQIIPSCVKVRPGYFIPFTYLSVANVTKADTAYVNESPRIDVFYTNTKGSPQGYGYSIYSVDRDFHIVQPTVPDSPTGTKAFRTYNDALKIAFLVAYRLEHFSDLPSIKLGDLYYLQIQGI